MKGKLVKKSGKPVIGTGRFIKKAPKGPKRRGAKYA